jgi:hypothetical protein
MTLFDSESQYREKNTIWRVLSLLPLYGNLTGGRIWRWFAVNIPMDFGNGGEFTSDIDIIIKLSDFPRSKDWIYKTMEVKVSRIHKDGAPSSLKVGKTARTITQLRAYRDFGAPIVSLLDVYVCESGFLKSHGFPPELVYEAVNKKIIELQRDHFGYQILPFEHGKDVDGDFGLLTIETNPKNRFQSIFNLLPSLITQPKESFLKFTDKIDQFYEKSSAGLKSHKQVVFCRNCRELQMVNMMEVRLCPKCGEDLILQS